MAYQENDTLREILSQARITFAGAAAKVKWFSGTQPAAGGTATTLLATGTFGSVIGTSASGVLTFGAITQTNSSHVAGTPTWMRIEKADGTWIWDFAIPADSTFSGAISPNVDVTWPTTNTITVGG